jgi:hypothetical protein
VAAPKPGNRFRFRFVFVSCVRASGRGEAAWAREGSASSSLGLWVANYAAAPPAFGAHFLSTGMWVLTVLGAFCGPWGCAFVHRHVGFKTF